MALWQARQVTVKIGNSVDDTNASFKANQFDGTTFGTFWSGETTITSVCKNVELNQPETSTDEVKLLGATSGNQNLELDPQSPGKAELTGTLLLNPEDDNDIDLDQFALTAITGTAGTDYPTGFTRYNYGSASPTTGVAMIVTFNAGSSKPVVNFFLNNATVETLGGFKIDADGHAEQEIKVTCAASDCWKEFDTDGGSA